MSILTIAPSNINLSNVVLIVVIVLHVVLRLLHVLLNSPWAKTQNFTYRYHLGGQILVVIFLFLYIPRLSFDMIDLADWQLYSIYHLLK